jgi:uncharacterized membrane protein
MNTKSANLVCMAFIAALIAYIVTLYPSLPDPLPTHWDGAGNVNGYMSKIWGTITFVSVPFFSVLLFKLIPIISPRGFRTEQFASVINSLMVVMVVFGSVIAVVALNVALGSDVNITKVVFFCVGLLLIFIGNFMGKFRKNFFIGIRTPWTLANDEVWAKTHRLGGWCFVGAGLLMAAMSFVGGNQEWVVFVVVGAALIPVVYSYFAYRGLEGFGPDPEINVDADLEP